MQTETMNPLHEKLQNHLRETVSEGTLYPTALPLCPEVKLYLLGDDYPRGRLDYDEMMAIINAPAYWAFCWASGQVLARYILQNPGRFRGKRIIDFGAGSGVVGVAAKLAGAAKVIACDIDPSALLACEANANLNQVEIALLADIYELEEKADWIIAADVLYDRENFPFISELPNMADKVLIADSRVKEDKLGDYEIVNRVTATTIPDLDEFKEFNDVRVYEALPVAH